MSCVADTNVTGLAATVPNWTVESEVKFVPVIVTVFPPADWPPVGLTSATDGGKNSTVAITLVGVFEITNARAPNWVPFTFPNVPDTLSARRSVYCYPTVCYKPLH